MAPGRTCQQRHETITEQFRHLLDTAALNWSVSSLDESAELQIKSKLRNEVMAAALEKGFQEEEVEQELAIFKDAEVPLCGALWKTWHQPWTHGPNEQLSCPEIAQALEGKSQELGSMVEASWKELQQEVKTQRAEELAEPLSDSSEPGSPCWDPPTSPLEEGQQEAPDTAIPDRSDSEGVFTPGGPPGRGGHRS